MCDNCSMAHEFPESDVRERYLCPDCGHEMWYWTSSDIDDETGLVRENYRDQERKDNSPYINVQSKPTVECPYCQSTDTKKISATSKVLNTAMFGIFGTKRHKQWHCNNCNSDF